MAHEAVLSATYLDILYAGRNKSYGGYVLRAHYNARALKSLGCITLLALSSLGAMYDRGQPLPPAQPYTGVVNVCSFEPVLPPPPPLPPPPATAAAAAPEATVPRIVPDDEQVEVLAPDELTAPSGGGGEAAAGEGPGPGEGMGTEAAPVESAVSTPPPAEPVRYVEQMPRFEGDINQFLARNLKYPTLARENNIQGRVSVQFVVDEEGRITQAKVIKGIGGGCEEEALRVVNAMPKWSPGLQNGRPVKVYIVLPILFVLN